MFTGSADRSPKQPISAEGFVQVEMFLVEELRNFQASVSTYMRGYLVFEDLQRQCLDARQFVEQADRSQPGYYEQVRREAWELVRDAFGRRPQGLDKSVEDLQAILAELKELISGEASPIYYADADRVSFAETLSRTLSKAADEVADLLGTFQRRGLDSLDRLTAYVESIFNRSEQARQAVSDRGPFGLSGTGTAPITPTTFGRTDLRNTVETRQVIDK